MRRVPYKQKLAELPTQKPKSVFAALVVVASGLTALSISACAPAPKAQQFHEQSNPTGYKDKSGRSHTGAGDDQALNRLKQELELTKNRPALASPATLIEQRLKDNSAARTAIYVQVLNFLKLESAHVKGASATLRALSPQGTLERGFAIVRSKAGEIVRTVSSVPVGTTVKIRFADGETSAEITAD
jgi:exonuclease VII large subunit